MLKVRSISPIMFKFDDMRILCIPADVHVLARVYARARACAFVYLLVCRTEVFNNGLSRWHWEPAFKNAFAI